MATVICPAPFSAAGSLSSDTQVGFTAADSIDNESWNPSDKHANLTLSAYDMVAQKTSGGESAGSSVRATISKSSGKWYWEIYVSALVGALGRLYLGVGKSAAPLTHEVGYDSNGWGIVTNDGDKIYGGNYTAYGTSCAVGDVVCFAVDLDAHKIWFAKNNAWFAAGDPAGGTDAAFSNLSGSLFPMLSLRAEGDEGICRFLAAHQSYSPPSGFSPLQNPSNLDPFQASASLSISDIYAGYVPIGTPLTAASTLSAKTQVKILGSTLSSVTSGGAKSTISLNCGGALAATSNFSCDECFNYAQIDATCPTPTSEITATFRYARLQAEAPTPTASFRVGKRIEGECPVLGFTCNAYAGRNPSIIASVPVPTCSIRVGLSLSVEAGVPVPTCSMIADTHHLATLYGNVPAPTCEIIADTENVTIISASAPCPRGLFFTAVGNVVDIYGRVPCPACSMLAITGTVVKLEGRVPVPGPLIRLHASLMNVSITLEGNMPVPTMTSSVLCSLPSLVLRHERGEVQ